MVQKERSEKNKYKKTFNFVKINGQGFKAFNKYFLINESF